MEYLYITIIHIFLNVEIYSYQFNCEFSKLKSEIFESLSLNYYKHYYACNLSIKILKR